MYETGTKLRARIMVHKQTLTLPNIGNFNSVDNVLGLRLEKRVLKYFLFMNYTDSILERGEKEKLIIKLFKPKLNRLF